MEAVLAATVAAILLVVRLRRLRALPASERGEVTWLTRFAGLRTREKAIYVLGAVFIAGLLQMQVLLRNPNSSAPLRELSMLLFTFGALAGFIGGILFIVEALHQRRLKR